MGLRFLVFAVMAYSMTCTGLPQANSGTGGANRAIAKPGGFQLLVYDAPPPGNIEAIHLTVVSVDVVKQDGGIVNIDPNESIVYNPGPDRYILKPVIEITGNSLVDGPFTVTGLIENETVVAELKPDGTMRMIGTFDPRIEIRGVYYFNYGTRSLDLDFSDVYCDTCSGGQSIPRTVFYNLPNSKIKVTSWDADSILVL
jgi:hypothetical protein